MHGATLIVGIALLLMALVGPKGGARPATTVPQAGRVRLRPGGVTTVRILAAVLGLALLIFSMVQFHSHGPAGR